MPFVDFQEMHTEQCIAALQKYQEACEVYWIHYPFHCSVCRGNGGWVSSYDPSPGGISLSSGSFVDFEYCPECIEKGHCPQCSDVYPLDEDGDPTVLRCPHCGFALEKDTGEPEHPECFCYENREVLIQEKMYPALPREEMLADV